MKRSLFKRGGYNALRVICRLVGVALFGFRAYGRSRVPKEGAVLVCANHQSSFDPAIVGMTCNRRLNYLARKSLFRFAPVRWLIKYLDAIPLNRDGLGMAGLKEALRRLNQGEMVLIFPEGTRTPDGEVGRLHPGFVMLARRSNVSVLPIGIDGAYQALPRFNRFPRLSRVHVCVGEPILPAQIAVLEDQELVDELERRMRECHAKARRKRLGRRA